MSRVASRSEFVAGTAGALFRTCSWPTAVGNPERDAVGATAEPSNDVPKVPGENLPAMLLVAPIGEEMNRSRRFLAALRRACARRGAHVVLVDPYGTGDSAGEFVDATWDLWVDDLVTQARALGGANGDGALTLLGLRSGCLLVDALARRLDPPPASIVEIQPEHDGATVVRRFLSARVLTERFAGRKGESVAVLEAKIAAGESLALGGYEVSAALLRALGGAAIDPKAAPRATGRSYRFDLTESPSSHDGDPGELSASTARAGANEGGRTTLSETSITSARPEAGRPNASESDADGYVASGSEVGGSDASWQVCHVPTRPFWQLAESVPDPHVVARIAERLFP